MKPLSAAKSLPQRSKALLLQPPIIFSHSKLRLLEKQLQQSQKRLEQLKENATFSQLEYDRLTQLLVRLGTQSSKTKIACLLKWFDDCYQPDILRLLLQTSSVAKLKHAKVCYQPMLGFWNDILCEAININAVCFAAINAEISRQLFGRDSYQSMGLIPFKVNMKYLQHKPSQRLSQQTTVRSWLMFGDRQGLFLPDSELSHHYLDTLQYNLNQVFG